MEYELVEEAFAAKKRIEKNSILHSLLLERVNESEKFSPIERKYQFGQDFGSLTISDGHDFHLDLGQTGCNKAIIDAILDILEKKVVEDKEFIENI
jgi:hypothetical protein